MLHQTLKFYVELILNSKNVCEQIYVTLQKSCPFPLVPLIVYLCCVYAASRGRGTPVSVSPRDLPEQAEGGAQRPGVGLLN